MDTPADNVPPADATGNDTTNQSADASKSARRAGGHAIERIAAAARALAESEVTAPGTDSAKSRDVRQTALVPATATFNRSRPSDAAKATARFRPNLSFYGAALCLALGVGGVLGGQLSPRTEQAADTETAKIERALPWKREMAEAQGRDTAKVRDDFRALRGEIAALRANNDQLRTAETQKQAQELRALRATLEAQKSETASLKADMTARFDRADKDAAQRSDKAGERVDRLERRLSDPVATSAIPKPAAEAAKPEKPPLRGIVLREAARGVALIETRRGLLEVSPGDPIPGAGRVETIEKHNGKWRVVTTTGVIDDQID